MAAALLRFYKSRAFASASACLRDPNLRSSLESSLAVQAAGGVPYDAPCRAQACSRWASAQPKATDQPIIYHLKPLKGDYYGGEGESGGAAAAAAAGRGPLWRYLIEVVTGSVRGAGTPNVATLQLFGATGASATFRIGDDGDNAGGPGFARDTAKTYAVEAPNLGSLRRVFVAKERSAGSELGAGWFLERVIVTVPDGTTVTFPCHAWVGEPDDASGAAEYERNLLPCVKPPSAPERAALPAPVTVRAAGLAIPDPAKLKLGLRGSNRRGYGAAGEDAYFYTPAVPAGGMFGLGVADGVYAWRKRGIDAGLFSQTLMRTAAQLVSAGYSDVLRIAQVCSRKVQTEGIYGSSTLCLAVVDCRWSRATAACLGDSALMLLGTSPENPKVHIKYRTSPQEHEFGWPFQLGHHAAADAPEDCMLASLRVARGDALVVGTDGLWDNLFDREVSAAVDGALRAKRPNPAALARELVGAAYERSRDRRAFTPYSFAASEWFDQVYDGGKPDDIAVVVAFVE